METEWESLSVGLAIIAGIAFVPAYMGLLGHPSYWLGAMFAVAWLGIRNLGTGPWLRWFAFCALVGATAHVLFAWLEAVYAPIAVFLVFPACLFGTLDCCAILEGAENQLDFAIHLWTYHLFGCLVALGWESLRTPEDA